MKLMEIIKKNARETGNKCGISPVSLAERTGLSLAETKNQLNELHKTQQVNIREGINHKIAFLK